MTYPNLSDSLVSLLKKVDTPTVCNAIEVAQKQRGFAAFTRKPMVGFAHTAKIAAFIHQPNSQTLSRAVAWRILSTWLRVMV